MTDSRDRPVWPLYVLAVLAFTPVLGFFVGSVAVSWALLSTRRGARRALAIAATGALLNIVGIIVFMAVLGGNDQFQQANLAGIRRDLGEVVAALEEHHARTQSYPETLALLQLERGVLRPLQTMDLGPGVVHLRLPQPFHYVVAPDGSSYDLFSVGPDGKAGTPDDIRPLVPDSLRDKTGLRPVP
jgi:hypothetical protein